MQLLNNSAPSFRFSLSGVPSASLSSLFWRPCRVSIDREQTSCKVGAHVFPLRGSLAKFTSSSSKPGPPHPPQTDRPTAAAHKTLLSHTPTENNNRGKPNLPPPNRQRETRHGEPPPGAAPIDLARPPLGPRRRVRVHPAAGRGGRPDALPAKKRRKITCVLHRFEPDCAPGLCR